MRCSKSKISNVINRRYLKEGARVCSNQGRLVKKTNCSFWIPPSVKMQNFPRLVENSLTYCVTKLPGLFPPLGILTFILTSFDLILWILPLKVKDMKQWMGLVNEAEQFLTICLTWWYHSPWYLRAQHAPCSVWSEWGPPHTWIIWIWCASLSLSFSPFSSAIAVVTFLMK